MSFQNSIKIVIPIFVLTFLIILKSLIASSELDPKIVKMANEDLAEKFPDACDYLSVKDYECSSQNMSTKITGCINNQNLKLHEWEANVDLNVVKVTYSISVKDGAPEWEKEALDTYKDQKETFSFCDYTNATITIKRLSDNFEQTRDPKKIENKYERNSFSITLENIVNYIKKTLERFGTVEICNLGFFNEVAGLNEEEEIKY